MVISGKYYVDLEGKIGEFFRDSRFPDILSRIYEDDRMYKAFFKRMNAVYLRFLVLEIFPSDIKVPDPGMSKRQRWYSSLEKELIKYFSNLWRCEKNIECIRTSEEAGRTVVWILKNTYLGKNVRSIEERVLLAYLAFKALEDENLTPQEVKDLVNNFRKGNLSKEDLIRKLWKSVEGVSIEVYKRFWDLIT